MSLECLPFIPLVPTNQTYPTSSPTSVSTIFPPFAITPHSACCTRSNQQCLSVQQSSPHVSLTSLLLLTLVPSSHQPPSYPQGLHQASAPRLPQILETHRPLDNSLYFTTAATTAVITLLKSRAHGPPCSNDDPPRWQPLLLPTT